MTASYEGSPLHTQANLTLLTNPHSDSEGFLFDELEARLAQKEALDALPHYEVGLAKDLESLKEPETTESGATIYQELATFIDMTGKLVMREVTIGEPNVELSPYAIVSADSWTTGANGLNRYKIKRYLDAGFPVVWVHHAGRHSPIRLDKSISRSAHQEHVLLDYMSEKGALDTSVVIGDGYSRGAMIREKFVAIAPEYGRKVPYSDLEAPCFARDMGRTEKVITLLRQLPSEMLGLASVARDIIGRAVEEDNPDLIVEFLGTHDFHPRNGAQELLWAHSLINSKVRDYIAATPVETEGVRTFFNRDIMSQRSTYEDVYAWRPNIQVLLEKGAHVEGATPRYIDKKINRLTRLIQWMDEHDNTMEGFAASENALHIPSTSRRKRHLGLIA